MVKMHKIALIFFLLAPFFMVSQQKDKPILKEDLYPVENDSIVIPLDEVIVLKSRKFDDSKERKYYYWYYKKVQKAYPYAVLAAKRMGQIDEQIEKIPNKRKQKKHIRKMQSYLEGEFTDELKTLTRTEGRILIKLIHRQTGNSFYEIIKDYRSDWNAFWYNSSAKLFKLNLKSEYHPESDPLDFIIEDILMRSFANGTLEQQAAKIQIDYFELSQQYASLNYYEQINAYVEKYK